MTNTITLVPFPQKVEIKDGFLKINSSSVFLVNNAGCLIKDIEKTARFILKAGYSVKEKIKEGTDPSSFTIPVTLKKTDSYNSISLPNEAYFLEITSSSINIAASSDAGFFYACTSVAQLLMTDNKLPCCCIYDKPAYKWRGFMLDTCRSFFSIDFIKKMLEISAFHKLNVFHWHLTDDQGWRLPVPEYPELVKTGSKRMDNTSPEAEDGLYDEGKEIRRWYTEEEIKDVVRFAEDLNIEIVPEVEFPGHTSALLSAYPNLGCTGGPYSVENRWGIFPDVVCLGNNEVFDVYDKIFSQIEKLFPGKYLHIGGDECLTTRWEKCPACQARMKEQKLDNMSQLQSWGTSKITTLILSHHKIPIGWDEVLDNTDKCPLPEDIIVQSWRGVEGGEKASSMNHQVIMSPSSNCYMNLKNIDSFEEMGRLGVTTCQKAYSFTPVTDKMSEKASKFVIGGECNFWSEKIRASRIAEYLMFPRFCALSECLWTDGKNKDFERFQQIIQVHKKRLSKMDVIYFNGSLR